MMKIRYQILTLSSALMIIGCGGGSGGSEELSGETAASTETSQNTTVITTPNPFPAELLADDTIATYMEAINTARSVARSCGSQGEKPAVPALAWSNALYGAAMEHSIDMAQSNTFTHDGSGTDSDWTGIAYGKKSTSTERTENNGYQDWRTLGENITAGTQRDSAQKAVNAWLLSDAHCATLMNPAFTEVGMAIVYKDDSEYGYYWTQNFGTKR